MQQWMEECVMSLQAAKEFVEKAKQSEALQKELQERSKSAVEIGRAHGFDFTTEELRQAWGEQKPAAGGEAPWTSVH
jgi:predicted ribosomally synthesized peptide with nif11-like leader